MVLFSNVILGTVKKICQCFNTYFVEAHASHPYLRKGSLLSSLQLILPYLYQLFKFLQNKLYQGTSGESNLYIKLISGPILGLRPANERRRYKVTASLIGWAQA